MTYILLEDPTRCYLHLTENTLLLPQLMITQKNRELWLSSRLLMRYDIFNGKTYGRLLYLILQGSGLICNKKMLVES